jgi:ketosteroid isomerase-like protein
MDDDAVRAVMRAWWDRVWRDGDIAAVDELVTDPYTRHTRSGNETIPRAEYRKRLVEFQRVLRGAVTSIDDEVVVGDKIWQRATSRGVSLETGELSVFTWMVIHRIEDGRIAESWVASMANVEWTG